MGEIGYPKWAKLGRQSRPFSLAKIACFVAIDSLTRVEGVDDLSPLCYTFSVRRGKNVSSPKFGAQGSVHGI